MLNTYLIFSKSVAAKYPLSEIERALKKQYEHPKLTERLANLKKLRVNLSKETENPWFDEMTAIEITEQEIQIISEFLKFQKAEKARKMKEYKKSGRGSFMMPHCYSVVLPHTFH